MSMIPIVLVQNGPLPSMLDQFADIEPITERRHQMALFCRSHWASEEELCKKAGTSDMKYVLVNSKYFMKSTVGGYEQYTGWWRSPTGVWGENRRVRVVDVNTSRPWTIISPNNTGDGYEALLYLDDFTPIDTFGCMRSASSSAVLHREI